MSGKREILVVTVPAERIAGDGFAQFREYVIESILRDVLVVDDETTLSIMEVPDMEPPKVAVEVKPEKPKKTEPAPQPQPQPVPETLSERDEKQKILERLRQYREKNGLGCLTAVARKACRKGITDNILRMLLRGDATVTLQDWRAIGKALDKLEEEEKKSDEEQKGGANA